MKSETSVSETPALPAVIILHGLARTSRMMRPLERKLQKTFRCFNWNYRSQHLEIFELAEELFKRIESTGLLKEERLYFAGHSMGGVLVRTLYGRHGGALPPGTLVSMGSPLGGASVAKLLWRFFPARWMFGPALQDLALATWLKHPAPRLRIHSIAGDIGRWDLINPLITRPHDLLVTLAETKIPELTSHRVVKASHAVQPFHRKVMAEVISILENETKGLLP